MSRNRRNVATLAAIVSLALAGACGGRRKGPDLPPPPVAVPEPMSPGDPEPLTIPTGQPTTTSPTASATASAESATPDAAPPPTSAPVTP